MIKKITSPLDKGVFMLYICNPKIKTMDVLKFNSVEEKIITVRGISVILDSDVAELYGVETKRINEALKNNPEKFPEGYVMEVSKNEKVELVENFDRFNKLKHSTAFPTAFTEKGLYMLATILKSPRATQTTIAIVEAFTKIRELSRVVSQLSETKDEPTQKSLMQKGGEIDPATLPVYNGIYDDEGNKVDLLSIPTPDLCLSCAKFLIDDWDENLLCDMNRADEREEGEEFMCYAWLPRKD